MSKKKTTTTNETIQKNADLRAALLESIVQESKQVGTEATKRAATIGDMCLRFGDNKDDRKTIEDRLEKEGLDSNITRQIGVACLVGLVPDAVKLPIGVAAKITPLVTHKKGNLMVRPKFTMEQVSGLVNSALAGRWTAEITGKELAKIRTPNKRNKKKNPKGLAAALKTIAMADLDELEYAFLDNPQAMSRMREALDELADAKERKDAA